MFCHRVCVFSLLTVALAGLGAEVSAQVVVYDDETAFLRAAGQVGMESFEGLTPTPRTTAPVRVPAFTVTPDPGLLSVSNGAGDSSGAHATDGTKFLFTWLEGKPTGTLRFDLTAPSTVFGFNVIDLGETDGILTLRTNAGETLTPVTLKQYPPLLANGNVGFAGIVQQTPFTQVFITATGVDDSYGIDKVYTTSSVPAPGSLLVGLLGCVPVLGLLRRRRH